MKITLCLLALCAAQTYKAMGNPGCEGDYERITSAVDCIAAATALGVQVDNVAKGLPLPYVHTNQAQYHAGCVYRGSSNQLYWMDPVRYPSQVANTRMRPCPTCAFTDTDLCVAKPVTLPTSSLTGWTVKNEASGSSDWRSSGGEIQQMSNLYSGNYCSKDQKGTMLLRNGATLTNGAFSAKVASADNDAVGIVFRYVDENNWYKYSHTNDGGGCRKLYKKKDGVTSTIWSKSGYSSYTQTASSWYTFKVATDGCQIKGYFQGVPEFTIEDSQCVSTGEVGLYTWGNTGGYWKDVQMWDSATTSPTLVPTASPTPSPTHATCQHTTCYNENGAITILTRPSMGDKYFCELEGTSGCKCTCHTSFECTLSHKLSNGAAYQRHHCPGGVYPTPSPTKAPTSSTPNDPSNVVNGRKICISGAAWEEYKEWDCGGADISSYFKDSWDNGSTAGKAGRQYCADECAKLSNCVAFNYPDPGNGRCWLKYGDDRKKSTILGKSCGGKSTFDYYTKVGTC